MFVHIELVHLSHNWAQTQLFEWKQKFILLSVISAFNLSVLYVVFNLLMDAFLVDAKQARERE